MSRQTMIHYGLGALLALLALNAFGGGYYAMAGAPGVPTEWLEGSAFSTYFVPGAILFVVVGGSALLASTAAFTRSRFTRAAAGGVVVVLLTWLVVQLMVIGYVSWMQPVTAAAALSILVLAYRLPPARATLLR